MLTKKELKDLREAMSKKKTCPKCKTDKYSYLSGVKFYCKKCRNFFDK